MRFLTTLPLLFTATLAAQNPINVEFTEVLVDPIGPNAGAQLVELTNQLPIPTDLTGWTLVTPTGSYPLPAVTLLPRGVALLHLGAAGTSSPADLYLPSGPSLATVGSLALFRSAQTTNPADLVDFVAWGGGQGAITFAVQAAQWPSTFASVTLPSHEGWTIAHYDQMAYGVRSDPSAWFADGTPTLGTPNDAGGIFAGAYGCPLMTYPPQLGSGAEDNRPWIGEQWLLDVSYLPPMPTTIFIAVGLTSTGSLSLTPFGITDCFFEVSPLAVMVRGLPPSQGQILTLLPNNPAVVGLELRLQALVPYPGANPADALVTRVLHAYLGSR